MSLFKVKVQKDCFILSNNVDPGFSQNWNDFFSEIFLSKKMDEITFFSKQIPPISFSKIQWGCFAKSFYTKISPENFNQIICYIKFQ